MDSTGRIQCLQPSFSLSPSLPPSPLFRSLALSLCRRFRYVAIPLPGEGAAADETDAKPTLKRKRPAPVSSINDDNEEEEKENKDDEEEDEEEDEENQKEEEEGDRMEETGRPAATSVKAEGKAADGVVSRDQGLTGERALFKARSNFAQSVHVERRRRAIMAELQEKKAMLLDLNQLKRCAFSSLFSMGFGY